MHTLLTLLGVLFVVVASYLTLGILRRLEGWTSRRYLQFWVLIVRVALGLARLALFSWFAGRRGLEPTAELQALADLQAAKLGMPHPRLLVRIKDYPLALTCGLRRPTLLLSTWMLEQLDRGELESVLAHELAHVARRDFLVVWLATMLRDAFFYLPTSRIAYRQLQCEKELACDDLAVGLTHHPLALASALAKVWQELVSEPTFGMAQSFTDQDDLIETRIERLMAVTQPGMNNTQSRAFSLKITALSLVSLVVVEVVSALVILGLMGCGPMIALFARFVG